MRNYIILSILTLFHYLDGSYVSGFQVIRKFEDETKLICPIDEESTIKNNDDFDGLTHQLAVFSVGEVGATLVERLRDKSLDYYESIVDYIIMFNCDRDLARIRCVDEDSLEAAKDWNDKCIQAADLICPTGTCERISNCYWKPVVSNQFREKRFHDDEYDEAEDALLDWQDQESYIGGMLKFAIPGLGIAVGLLLLWIIYFLGRMCCCCLWKSCDQCNVCSPIPKQEGYNICWEIRFPISLYFICLVGIVFTGTLAYIGNEDISNACTNTFNYGRGLLADSQKFLDRSKEPLVNIESIAYDAANDAQFIFGGTEYVQKAANMIKVSFVNYGVVHSEGIDLSDSRSEFNEVVTTFQDKIDPIVLDITSMLSTLEQDVYSNVDNIQIALSSAIEKIDTFRNKTLHWDDEIDKVESKEANFRDLRKGFVLSLFVVSLVFAVIGLVAVLYSKQNAESAILYFLNVTWIFCALLGTLSFILASVSLCFSLFWFDTCKLSAVVISDFEPIVGEAAAAGVNACFDGTNLAVAYNVTDKLDYQAKLDEGLEVLETINITEEFNKVISPLVDLQIIIDGLTNEALMQFNKGISTNTDYCQFGDNYLKDNILNPWDANVNKNQTDWVVNSTGLQGDYQRFGIESNVDYIKRIYTTAGKCTGTSCCLNDNCDVEISQWCNKGDDCSYFCNEIGEGILSGYKTYLSVDVIERNMTADLGVRCPSGFSCPSTEFGLTSQSNTMLSLIATYGENITATSNQLVNLTSTKVGEAMQEIEDFLCNMDVSFVGDRYTQIEEEFCETMFGGFTQISGALWVISILLEVTAILASVLSIRLRGVSEDEADEYFSGVKTLRRADLYG